MDLSKEIIISFLEKVFDEPKRKFDNIVDFEFNCNSNKCKHDVNKFNLTYNVNKNVFNCWKCYYRGNIYTLLKKFGNEDDYDILSSIIDDLKHVVKKEEISKEKKVVELPEGFQFLEYAIDSVHKKNAIAYLNGRGLGINEIKKFKIGFTEIGKYRFRIIIPSYNLNGELNYFEARSFYPNIQPNYLKPDSTVIKKTEIIFNEQNVSFNVPVFLVEGVFDMFTIYNAIPLLGKRINIVLLNKLIKYKTPVVLCLDEDAISEVVSVYYFLNSFGIDVYWCKIKDDLAKVYEREGKQGIINTLSNIEKITVKTIMQLKMFIKESVDEFCDINKEEMKQDWELIKQTFKK